MDISTVDSIVDKHAGKLGGIMSILEDIQAKYSYLPEEALRAVSKKTGVPMVDLYGIATFYKVFSLKPRGRHLISVCLGTACHVRGGEDIAGAFCRELEVERGETTSDNEFTLDTVACLGACAIGPIVMVDGHYYSQVKPSQIGKIIDEAKKGFIDVGGVDQDKIFPVEVSCPRCNHQFMDPDHLIDGYPSIRVTISFGNNHGWLRLSSLYGSYSLECEFEPKKDQVVNFFCPHCHGELLGGTSCVMCGAPMVPMIVRGGGMVEICSRKGCTNHMLDLSGVNF